MPSPQENSESDHDLESTVRTKENENVYLTIKFNEVIDTVFMFKLLRV
jgi:hypothetical protein